MIYLGNFLSFHGNFGGVELLNTEIKGQQCAYVTLGMAEYIIFTQKAI